ncbi:creatininase family protein [Tengunoibacter tsumagoiensis]|uniref:Creatininase n=1 Tax=Tengunoibacter tsumagoiensis TaxID=2014871 RepID=A0A402AA18_9CHLR|nr:creatininase family protein [Tengunoibacter tsumagoiensis]GCE15741.1 creatininase [Tengunoibacter tsumagoiensis]
MITRPILFQKLTDQEINEIIKTDPVVIIPAATLEDHGPHLPVDTDVVIAEAICQALAQKIPDEVVLMPCINIGYSPHHIDGPGTVTIQWDTFINYCKDITRSLIHHGFKRLIFVNAHGSNHPVLDMAARLTNVENPEARCALVSWWSLKQVQQVVRDFRESEISGHGCELETSLYLAIQPEAVDMSKAVKDYTHPRSPHFWADLVSQSPDPTYGNPVPLTEYWSTVSETSVWGDATKATREKGELILQTASDELIEIVRELKARPIRPRVRRQGFVHTDPRY